MFSPLARRHVLCRKFEEIYPPTVREFVYITDDTYTDSQLKRMEHVMLKMLAFDMSAPTSNWFLNYFIDNGGAGEDTVKHLAQVGFAAVYCDFR